MPSDCPFCALPDDACVVTNSSMRALRDVYPVTPGHTLIVPRRHAASFADLSDQEKSDLMTLLDEVRSQLEEEFSPDGFNVGFNDGPAAGQTVMHFHMHVIPRKAGDQADPRGGIRLIFPDKAVYWEDGD